MHQQEMRIFSNQCLYTYIYCTLMFTKYQNSPGIYVINKTNKDLQILKVEIMNFIFWFLFFQDSITIFHTCNWRSLLLTKVIAEYIVIITKFYIKLLVKCTWSIRHLVTLAHVDATEQMSIRIFLLAMLPFFSY